jgi:FKBP-type peptidyl-prolyl cis-trans isomerase 2
MEQEIRKAKKGDAVKVNFTCTLKDGTVYDSSEGKEPLEFVIGENEVFSSLEEAVIGMSKNESKKMQIHAENVFGQYLKDQAQVVERDQFPENLTPEVGLEFRIEQADRKTTVLTVTDVTDDKVTLTPKHPFAGEEILFDIQLLDLEQSDKSKAEEHYKQGVAAQDKGLYDDAINSYRETIRLNPNHAGAFYNLGVAWQEKGLIDQAIIHYEIAIGLNQNFTEAHHNLGIAFKDKGQTDEAVHCFQRVLQLNPNHAGAYYNFGGILVSRGKYDEALQCYRKALELKPDYAEAQWNIALINLLHGKFEEGWKGYEWRWQLKGVSVARTFAQPRWDGSDITGRSILLYTEQGFGDTIQFVRYAPLVAQRGAKVIVECQKELTSLLQNVDGIQTAAADGESLPGFDVQCPLLSLPMIFGTTIENIPAHIPYVTANADSVQTWKNKVLGNASKLNVGLVWSGDPDNVKIRDKSFPLDTLLPLAEIDSISFYSLQKGNSAKEAINPPGGMRIIDYTEMIADFSDTAALIQSLDLIISVDTAVAHLAGALGKPVWTLLPFAPDWRWLLEREDSPWYPTMRLFRQPSPGDWESVIVRIKKALRELAD